MTPLQKAAQAVITHWDKGIDPTDAMSELRNALEAEQAQAVKPFEIEFPDYHGQAMRYGLEDRNITDRYEAMRYGWDQALERVEDCLPEKLYTHPAPPAQAVEPIGYIRHADKTFWPHPECAVYASVSPSLVPVCAHPAPPPATGERAVEPVATVQCINGVTIGYLDVMQPVGTKLYLHPATPTAGERGQIINRLRSNHITWRDTIDRCSEAADMLEADAPKRDKQWHDTAWQRGFKMGVSDAASTVKNATYALAAEQAAHRETNRMMTEALMQSEAQQVAAPDGWALVPIGPTEEMIVALMCTGLRHAEYRHGCDPTIAHMAQGYTAMLAAAQGAKLVTQQVAVLEKREPLNRVDILNMHALRCWPRTMFADKSYGIALDTVTVVDFVRIIESHHGIGAKP